MVKGARGISGGGAELDKSVSSVVWGTFGSFSTNNRSTSSVPVCTPEDDRAWAGLLHAAYTVNFIARRALISCCSFVDRVDELHDGEKRRERHQRS